MKDLIFLSGKIAAFREILEYNGINDDGKICVPADQIITSVKNLLSRHEFILIKTKAIPACKYSLEEYK